MSMGRGAMYALLGATSALAMGTAAAALPAASGGAPLAGMASAALRDKSAVVAPALATQTTSFEVFLPLRNEAALDTLLVQQQSPKSASYHKWLTPAQFGAQFGPTAASVASVKVALEAQGLSVATGHTRSVTVSGTVGQINKAFGVSLQKVTTRDGASRLVAPTTLALPAALRSAGAVVVSFNGLPAKRPNSKVITTSVPQNRNSSSGGYYFTDLRQAYNFPAYNAKLSNGQILDGTGASVAVLMSADALDSDIKGHFDHENFTTITGKAAPTITHVPINGGGGGPGSDAFYESSLDVQEVLGGAPGAKVSLINIPSLNDYDIIGGYLYIVEANAYDIVNSSFGGCELGYTAEYNGGQDYTGVLRTYDTLFKQGNAQGVTFVASSGDSGGLSCPSVDYFNGGQNPTFVRSVQFPSDSPNVTGVGGGNLITTTPPSPQTTPPTLKSSYVSENANGDPEIPYDVYGFGTKVSGGYWGAGGGRSQVFATPPYQAFVNNGSNVKRTIPDVGMQVGGCPGGIAQTPCGPDRSYVIIYANGSRVGLIGTSVSSPEFVGATALYIQRAGRQGNLNYFLYSKGAQQTADGANAEANGTRFYNTGIQGFDGRWDGTFPTTTGYNYLYGNGSPRVRRLFGFLDLPQAGDPQTPSNP